MRDRCFDIDVEKYFQVKLQSCFITIKSQWDILLLCISIWNLLTNNILYGIWEENHIQLCCIMQVA